MERRSTRAVSVVLACAGALAAASTAAVAAPAPVAPDACTSTQTIQISSLVFQPPTIFPGQSSQAIVSAVNCTAQPQQASAEWLGHFVGFSTGAPPGCPAIDPLVLAMNFPPRGQLSATVRYLVPGSCTAYGLVVTVEIIQQGRVVAQRTAELGIEQPLPP